MKTRFLQINDTVMLEVNLCDSNNNSSQESSNTFLFTELKDGHYSIFSTLDNEFDFSGSEIERRGIDDITSLNTIYHYSVPEDSACSTSFSFVDPNAEYIDSNMSTSLIYSSTFVYPYCKYCTNPFYQSGIGDNQYFKLYNLTYSLRRDSFKFYLVNGYDFSDLKAFEIRISVNRNDLIKLDLCNFFATKGTAYSCVKYLSKPIIFGNNIYDRYIELNPFSLYDLIQHSSEDFSNVTSNTSLKLEYSFIYGDSIDYSEVEFPSGSTDSSSAHSVTNTNCEFSKSLTLKGTIPTQTLNSDNLGVYIAESYDSNYVEFYGTWKEQPLTINTVQSFNKSILLYDKSFAKKQDVTYEVEEDYQVEVDTKKWLVVHEIECNLMNNNSVLKTDTYSLTQIFVPSSDSTFEEQTKFYYRPVIFDSDLLLSTTAIVLNYNMRLINTADRVQFTKSASLSLTNVNKFYGKGTNLNFSQSNPFKVYNHIETTSPTSNSGAVGITQTKYVKVFYDSTNISMTNGDVDYPSGGYTLQMSKFPKNYKFVFKNKTLEGITKYFDLTNSYYKLYIKNGSDNIIIEPTYSKNMNLALGEIEFTIGSGTLTKLQNIPEESRYMSIVAYNADGSVSSLFDMKYTF